jgi:uncharacterized protein
MGEMLPLFPLGTVLYPGLLLPLHVFEERYRMLVRDLLDTPEPRSFGVIAIRKGRETGVDGVSALYEVGCVAVLRQVTELPDGRFELVTVGTQRFRLKELDRSGPYLRGELELLPEQAGARAAAGETVRAVQDAFRGYLEALAGRGVVQVGTPALPDEPVMLSYLVAASMVVDLADRQALLAEPDAMARLAAERSLLQRETTMLRTLTSAPAPELRYSPYSSN